MTRTEISAVLEQVGKVVLREFPIPAVGPDDALLKVEMVGVCGTDPKIYRGKVKMGELPLILGHEVVGRIEDIGANASEARKIGPGDRVLLSPGVGCGYCVPCLSGTPKYCENAFAYGLLKSSSVPPHLWGGYGQYVYLAPRATYHKITEDLPAEAAILIDAVVANGIQWVRRLGQVTIGDAVLIQGSGQQGLSAVVAARESGASPIIMTGRTHHQDRFALAREFGADYVVDVLRENLVDRVKEITGGRMADVVIDVTGDPDAVAASLDVVKKQGTVVLAGLTGTGVLTPMAVDRIVFKEIRVQGAYAKSTGAVMAGIRLVESRKYPLEKMVTDVFPLAEAEKALQAAGGELPGKRPIKVAIKP